MLKATPPTKKKRLGWVQDWVGDWFSEALPAVGKLPMCRRSQECSRISLHRTFLVPLRGCCCLPIPLVIGTLAAPQSNYYNYNLQNPTTTTTTTTYKSNYNYYNIQIQLVLLQHTTQNHFFDTHGVDLFLFCVASKKSIQLVLPSQGPGRILKGHTKSQHRTTCHMCWIRTSLVKIWIWKWSEFSFFK